MNSIANPRRIEAPLVTRLVATGQPATVIATVILSVLIISFRPFQPAGAQLVGQGGDIVNQLGFGTLGALSLASLFTLTDRRVLSALLSPWWLLLFGFLFLS
ncbi:MAG: O-antigen ligase family protein, partial [Micrococcales bacterium]|nr:O-antigen ligase family protein [Micrococcales bacterium]